MVGDVTDEDELNTGTRSEGSFYSVYWWFIKMGTAFASFVTGALIVFTRFDEKQSIGLDRLSGHVREAAAVFKDNHRPDSTETTALLEKLRGARADAAGLVTHFTTEAAASAVRHDHCLALAAALDPVIAKLDSITAQSDTLPSADALRALLEDLRPLSRQAPGVLWRMRLTEIGLPALLSLISLVLLRFYPLAEPRHRSAQSELSDDSTLPAGPD